MFGLTISAHEYTVKHKYGDEKWDEIKKLAGIEAQVFSRMESYDDTIIGKILESCCKVLKLKPEEVLFETGQYWIPYTRDEGFAGIFEIAGNNFVDFVTNLDGLHKRVNEIFKGAKTPHVTVSDVTDKGLKVHYYTQHPGIGLCIFFHGTLDGLANHFNEKMTIQKSRCCFDGADHCVFEIALNK